MPSPLDQRLERALAAEVHRDDGDTAFGELTAADADDQCERLRALTGFGPTMRVRPVAEAWRQLAKKLREQEAASVSKLGPDQVIEFAERTWVLPPRGGFLNASQ